MKCTFNSVDENSYSKISVTIPPLGNCRYTSITCTSLTANCNIKVLSKRDYLYLTVGFKPWMIWFDDFTNLNAEVFGEYLNEKLKDTGVRVRLDNCNRFVIEGKEEFVIGSLTYNVKLLMGLYSKSDDDFRWQRIKGELVGETSESQGIYRLEIKSVGMFLLTPVLHLVSNLGDPSLRNDSNNLSSIQSCNTVLDINNSFSANIPIVASGGDITSIVPSGAVSGAVFILVDGNMHQVELLSPMYITLRLEAIEHRSWD